MQRKKYCQQKVKIKKISSNRHDIGSETESDKKYFHIFSEEVKKNLADNFTKHHTICHHRAMRPRYAKATKKFKTQKNDKLVPGEGVLELPIQ